MEENTERKPGERFLMWFLLALSLFVFIVAWQMPHDSFSSIGGVPALHRSGDVPVDPPHPLEGAEGLRLLAMERGARPGQDFRLSQSGVVYIVVLVLYILLLYPLHFWVSSYLFLVGSFLLLKGAKLVRALITGAIMLAVIWLLFQYIFRIVLW